MGTFCPSESLPRLKTWSPSLGKLREGGSLSKVRAGQRSSLVFSTSKQKQGGRVTLMPKTGCWLWLGVSTSLPLDVGLTAAKGSGLHGVAQLCLLTSAPQK